MHFSLAHKPVILLTLLSLLASVLSAPIAVRAQDAPLPTAEVLQISTQGQAAVITYTAAPSQLSAADAAGQLPTGRYGGYELPIEYVTLAVAADSQPQVELQQVTAAPLATPLQASAPETPTAIGWEPDPSYTPAAAALPAQPVFIARQGTLGGQRYIVVAISPIYAQDGVQQLATNLQATVAGATPITADTAAAVTAAQGAASTAAVQVPINAAALTNSYKLTVATPGLQEVLYSDLGLGGAPAALRLTVGGVEVAVEKTGDRLRFYAPEAGDRWNASSAYWLTLETGAAMANRSAVPAGPAVGAYAEGEWSDNLLYETGYAGADGDHWFHADLKAGSTLPSGSDIAQTTPVTVPVTIGLPLRAGTSTYQVVSTGYLLPTSAAYCNTPYQFHVQGLRGGAWTETQVVSWQPNQNCKRQATSTAVITSDAAVDTLLLRLNPNGSYSTGIKLESVTWRRPVELDFQAIGAGVEFVTDGGAGSLTLRNLPAAWQLYDVTLPAQPQIVANGAGGEYTLNQAAAAPAGRYLLANLGAPIKPAVKSHAAALFGNVKAANAIYIGPAAHADELAPLLKLRAEQGYTPVFVDVQTIYDVFSSGQVSAVALRNFLRQESDWQNRTRKISVVLVGDATVDPFAYGGTANETLVAAWMDDVDPYQGAGGNDGEAACDACIAQLDGDDPVTGDNQGVGQEWFAADVWIGRLPVRNEAETAAMVAKLVAYDTSTSSGAWRTRKVFMADNYIKALDGQQNAKPDEAGDFAALSDNIVQLLPNPAGARRIYYDPAPTRLLTSTPVSGGYYQTVARALPENWRIKDIVGINTEVIATLTQGASLVTYNGHSNHFYYARTEDVYATGIGDKWLLNAPEVSLLGNVGKEFVMLSMTCYTAQFVKPTANGTLDEWLIRHKNGGAAAVWGPTGLSVVSGHDLLQKGFMLQLIGASAEQRMGQLVEAGNTYLLLQNGPIDPLMTFVLLGDPLSRARISTRDLYLPAIQR